MDFSDPDAVIPFDVNFTRVTDDLTVIGPHQGAYDWLYGYDLIGNSKATGFNSFKYSVDAAEFGDVGGTDYLYAQEWNAWLPSRPDQGMPHDYMERFLNEYGMYFRPVVNSWMMGYIDNSHTVSDPPIEEAFFWIYLDNAVNVSYTFASIAALLAALSF